MKRWLARELARNDTTRVGFWPLLTNDRDFSGRGNHATPQNGCGPVRGPGKNGYRLAANGFDTATTDEYLSLGNCTDLAFDNNFPWSVSLWFFQETTAGGQPLFSFFGPTFDGSWAGWKLWFDATNMQIGLTCTSNNGFASSVVGSIGVTASPPPSPPSPPSGPQSQTYSTAGTYTFTVPAGVTSVTVQCWGGGGGAGNASSFFGSTGGGGGGGGAYAETVLTVTANADYTVTVGAGGNAGVPGGTGGSSWFDTDTTVLAVGGDGASGAHDQAGGLGGLAGNCIGTTLHSGGNGGTQGGGAGGGGGGGAGSGGDGGIGGSPDGGAGGTPDGGAGGAGGSSAGGNGSTAIGPGGGGGGGGGTTGIGSNGADGQVIISWSGGSGGSGGGGSTSNPGAPIFRWYHIALTYNGSGAATGFHLYVNGRRQVINFTNTTVQGSWIPPILSSANGYIGRGPDTTDVSPVGVVRIVQAWRRELGGPEVVRRYREESQVDTFGRFEGEKVLPLYLFIQGHESLDSTGSSPPLTIQGGGPSASLPLFTKASQSIASVPALNLHINGAEATDDSMSLYTVAADNDDASITLFVLTPTPPGSGQTSLNMFLAAPEPASGEAIVPLYVLGSSTDDALVSSMPLFVGVGETSSEWTGELNLFSQGPDTAPLATNMNLFTLGGTTTETDDIPLFLWNEQSGGVASLPLVILAEEAYPLTGTVNLFIDRPTDGYAPMFVCGDLPASSSVPLYVYGAGSASGWPAIDLVLPDVTDKSSSSVSCYTHGY